MIPESKDLNRLLKSSAEFVDFELYLATGLENSLADQLGLSAEEVMCVVQLDEEPIKSLEGDFLVLSYSGRIYPPSVDKEGSPLKDPDFEGAVEEFFKKEKIEFSFLETEILSFTCSLPSVFMGVPKESAPAGDQANQDSTDTQTEKPGTPEASEQPEDSEDSEPADAADFIKSIEKELGETEEAEEKASDTEPKEAPEEPKETAEPEEAT